MTIQDFLREICCLRHKKKTQIESSTTQVGMVMILSESVLMLHANEINSIFCQQIEGQIVHNVAQLDRSK